MWHAMDEEDEINVLLAKVQQQFRELDALTLQIFPDAVKRGFLGHEDAVAARHLLTQQGTCEKLVEPEDGKEKHAPENAGELGMFDHTVFEQDCSRAFTPVQHCSNPCPGSPVPFVTFSPEGSIGNWSSPARSVHFAREGSVQTWHSPFKVI
jgi:hypothetical protein